MTNEWDYEEVDVYVCERCLKGFSVKRHIEPHNCPVCGSNYWKFSHEGILRKED